MSARLAVRIASSASCLALLKPMKGAFLGSQMSTMLAWGYLSKRLLSLLRNSMDTSWSSCGDASNTLLTAVPDASEMLMRVWLGAETLTGVSRDYMHPLIRPLIRPAWTLPRIMPIETYQACRTHLSCLSRGYLMGPRSWVSQRRLLARLVRCRDDGCSLCHELLGESLHMGYGCIC